MSNAMKLVRAVRRDERGLTTVEYLIVLCLLAAVTVATWRVFGSNVKELLADSGQQISDELATGVENQASGIDPGN